MCTWLTRERERATHCEHCPIVQQQRWHQPRARNVRPLVERRQRAEAAAVEQRRVPRAQVLCALRAERPVLLRGAAGRTAHGAHERVDHGIRDKCEARRVAEEHRVAQGVRVPPRHALCVEKLEHAHGCLGL